MNNKIKTTVLIFAAIIFVNLSNAQDSTHVKAYLKDAYKVYPYLVNLDSEVNNYYELHKYIQLEDGRIVLNERYAKDTLNEEGDTDEEYYYEEDYYYLDDSLGAILSLETAFDENISPSIDPLPDGKYVQYFAPKIYVDGDTIKFIRNKISCVFYLKNNKPEGKAFWFLPYKDDCLFKYGVFVNGKREGVWHEERHYNQFDPNSTLFLEARMYIWRESVLRRVFRDRYWKLVAKIEEEEKYQAKFEEIVLAPYENGLLNGLKTYAKTSYWKKGNETWMEKINYTNGKLDGNLLFLQDSIPYLTGQFKDGYKIGDWYRYSVEEGKQVLREHYKINESKTPGKSIIIRSGGYVDESDLYMDKAYLGDYFHSNIYGNTESISNYYGINMDKERYRKYRSDYDYQADKILIDSFGYTFYYTEYQSYYRNGQISFQFKLNNGTLEKEEPIYWENGKVRNSVTFDPLKKRYTEHEFSEKGKLISTDYYDEKGYYIDTIEVEMYDDFKFDTLPFTKDGRRYVFEEYCYCFMYEKEDVPLINDDKTFIIFETISNDKKTVYSTQTYSPMERRYVSFYKDPVSGNYHRYALSFDPTFTRYSMDMEFQEDKLRVSYSQKDSIQDSLITKLHAILQNGVFSYEMLRLLNQGNYFVDNQQISYNDKPVSGKICFHSNLSSDNYRANIKKRGSQLHIYANSITMNRYVHMMFPCLHDISEAKYFEGYKMGKKQKKSEKLYRLNTVELEYTDGQITSDVVLKSKKNKILANVPIKNNRIEGNVMLYTDFPYYSTIHREDTLNYSHYLSGVIPYKNGNKSGFAVDLNEKGDTIQTYFFKDDKLDGKKNSYGDTTIYTHNYVKGEVEGETVISNFKGQVFQTYSTHNGMRQGKHFVYDAQGKKIFELNFDKGVLQDSSYIYNEDKTIERIILFDKGKFIQELLFHEGLLQTRFFNDTIRTKFYTHESSIKRRLTYNQRSILENSLSYYEGIYRYYSYGDEDTIIGTFEYYDAEGRLTQKGYSEMGVKKGLWSYNFPYEGTYTILHYSDSVIQINDTLSFVTNGMYEQKDAAGNVLSKRYVLSTESLYNCGQNETYEIVGYYIAEEKDSSLHLRNGLFKTYYSNGVKQSEGKNLNGLPTGLWKFYNDNGSLREVGYFINGKKTGRWLSGDLAKIHYMGDICMDLDNEKIKNYMQDQEKQLDIIETYYDKGEIITSESFRVVK